MERVIAEEKGKGRGVGGNREEEEKEESEKERIGKVRFAGSPLLIFPARLAASSFHPLAYFHIVLSLISPLSYNLSSSLFDPLSLGNSHLTLNPIHGLMFALLSLAKCQFVHFFFYLGFLF